MKCFEQWPEGSIIFQHAGQPIIEVSRIKHIRPRESIKEGVKCVTRPIAHGDVRVCPVYGDGHTPGSNCSR